MKPGEHNRRRPRGAPRSVALLLALLLPLAARAQSGGAPQPAQQPAATAPALDALPLPTAPPEQEKPTLTPPPVAPAAVAPAAPAPAARASEKDAAPAGKPDASGASTSVTVVPPAAAGQAGAGAAPDEAFELKVKALEESANELKEKIFRTKARLLLLQETVLGGDITSGARAVLTHRNEMGSSFVLETASYALDGAPIFTRVDNDGDLGKKQEIEIFSGRIVPGNHQISVKLQYHGHGYGLFSYLEGYKFKVQSSYTFNAEGGKVTAIKIVGYEKGNLTTDLKDRPAVKYDVEVTRDAPKRVAARRSPDDAPDAAAGADAKQ